MILGIKINKIFSVAFLGVLFYYPVFAKTLPEYESTERALVQKLASVDPQDLTRATRKEVRQLFQEVASFLSEVSNSDLHPNEKASLIIDLAQRASHSLKAIERGFEQFPSKDSDLHPVIDVPRRSIVAWAQAQAKLWTLRSFRSYRTRRALLKQIMHDLDESIKKSSSSQVATASQALVIGEARSTNTVSSRRAVIWRQPHAWMLAVYGVGLGLFLMHDPFDFVGIAGRTHFSGAMSGIFYNTWQLLSVWAYLNSTGGHFAHDILHLEKELQASLGENGCNELFKDPDAYLRRLMPKK